MDDPSDPGQADVWADLDLDADRLREECGVFGIFGHPDAAAITALGLHALQHRGQEAAGIVSFDGRRYNSERRLGLVGDHFSKASTIERLPGDSAIGHVRYSTTGETILRNVQPLFAELNSGGFAVAHNGNLTNGLTLRRDLVQSGAIYQSTSDTEVILHLMARSRRPRIVERFVEALRALEGAYALVALSNTMLIGARDPLGIRPLVLGELDGHYHSRLRNLRARHHRRAFRPRRRKWRDRRHLGRGRREPASVPAASDAPLHFRIHLFRQARLQSCMAARSIMCAKAMGAELAREAGVAADVVVPVPDSGVPAAIGYAQASGVPFELGIIRNHYVGRTFIQPTQSVRELGVRLKHSANRAVVEGKRIILIDNSIVRGTTSVKIVQMMREAGAREVHFRISSPPITHPDYYGIDTPVRENLLAATHTLEEMRDYIGCDSLAFLSVEGIYRAMGEKGRDPVRPQFTDHCFTGDYPTHLTDLTGETKSQLSLLAEAS